MSRKIFIIAIVLFAATACAAKKTPVAPTPTPSAAAVAYPQQITTSAGLVTIPKKPERIISLSATATQMVFAVGAGRQVVAVDQYSTYPTNAPRTKLSGFQPNIEAITGYRPDLVLIESDQGGLVKSMNALHVPVLVLPAAKDLSGTYDQINELGRVTSHVDGAQRLVSNMRHEIAQIVTSVPKASNLSIYHELDQTYYTATSATFIGQIYKMFGLTDIADKAGLTKNSGYPQLSSEYIVSADPQLIVLADTVCCKQTKASVAARPGWSKIAAVQHDEVIPVDDSLASQWGPRIVDYVRLVAGVVTHAESVYKAT